MHESRGPYPAGTGQVSPEAIAIAKAWCEEWDALTDEEREVRNEALAQAIKEASHA